MVRGFGRGGVLSAAMVAGASAACSLLYGLTDNVAPDASVAADGSVDGAADVATDVAVDAKSEAASDAGADAPPSNWCAVQMPSHFFCEDFDESTSVNPDGFNVICGAPTLTLDASTCGSRPCCESAPHCVSATNGGCVAIQKLFAVAGHGKATVTFWVSLDAHDRVKALNKVAKLEFLVPDAGGVPYAVGVTDFDTFYLYYIATDGGADHSAFGVNALPGFYPVTFTVDLDARTLNGTVNGSPAPTLTLQPPIPSSAEVVGLVLSVGIPDSTVDGGENVHVDDVTFDLH